MRRSRREELGRLAGWLVVATLLVPSLPTPAEAQSRAQKKDAAAKQYERAGKMRAALNGKPQDQRTLTEFKGLVSAYRRVYLLSPHAEDVTAALLAVAETYQEMGRQFDSKYYQSAIDAYQFLLHQYPASRYRDDALFTIARIQQSDLNQLDAAEMGYQEFLKRFPRSSKAEEARAALKEIAAAREKEKKSTVAEVTKERETQRRVPQVTSIRHWNAENYTRIVISVEDDVKLESARIANPDRIYFDLSKARLSSTLAGKTLEVDGGFLKTIRVAQNQLGVVRMVLEVDKVKDYSVMRLENPYRLVVDVYGEGTSVAKAEEKKEPPRVARKEETSAKEEKTVETAKAEPPPKKSQPAKAETKETAKLDPPTAPKPTRNGQINHTRVLGLKVGSIVIDAGHGGHDTGTIGASGLMEKDLCLDIALRLGKLIQEKMPGTKVVYTREDDTFVPLEDRTALANQVKADMFISIHANSSRDKQARGVETYYLNFATSEDAMEVASRENALSQGTIHELQDIIKKIARNEKIEESRELAAEIQDALAGRLRRYSRHIKDRGVKKAPFVVLIGANMPSVLAEISFLSNPTDETALKKSDHRDRVVEGLFKGVESYLQSLNSLTYNQAKAVPTTR